MVLRSVLSVSSSLCVALDCSNRKVLVFVNTSHATEGGARERVRRSIERLAASITAYANPQQFDANRAVCATSLDSFPTTKDGKLYV
jgi:hypothetical protein